MADLTIDMKQVERLASSFRKAGKDYRKGTKRLLKKIGVVVLGLARKYSPESPTKAQYVAELEDGVTLRDNSSFTTGQLRKSIQTDTGTNYVSINVPLNSPAGKYAEKMHDEKWKSWSHRGPRTREKGSKADDKFIFRAAEDSEKKIDAMIDDVIDEMIKGIGV